MGLDSVFPIEDIRTHFGQPVTLTQLGMQDYSEIVEVADETILNIALASWNRIVHGRKHRVNPQAMAEYVFDDGPGMVRAIRELIGKPVIKDISYNECKIDDNQLCGDSTLAEGNVVARLVLAQMYPNSIHIADVYFCDPYKPIAESERAYQYRTHHGLGLLGKVFERVEAYASKQGVPYVTLTAAADDLVPLFGRYGYQFEKNDIGKMARAMEKRVSQH